MKPCMKCGRTLLLEQFYRHKMTADGYSHKCKDCTKADARRHPKSADARRAYYAAHREQCRARANVQQFARHHAGHAPSFCEACGAESGVERHHHDYSQPLEVVWLCKPCHAVADKVRRAIEARREMAS